MAGMDDCEVCEGVSQGGLWEM